MPRVIIIGSGNVAYTFGRRLKEKGCEIRQVHSRNPGEGAALARDLEATYVDAPKDLDPEVEIIMIAVSDDAIHETARSIPKTSALVVHCSGSTPLSVLPQRSRAVIWPLRSIAKGQQMTWHDMNIIMESDSDYASVRAMDLIALLGAKAVEMDSQRRKMAHLIAVILNNFSNHLLHMADVLCAEVALDRRIFQDLMEHTLHNSGPAIESQTGPAVREDDLTMDKQMKLLADHPHFKDVYEAISRSIIKEKNDQEL
ncbi:MAG: DUF2520 domain-containing protein [Flavobacteriales bacterium]|nr:DUF2520 domain-containing protein [Flavobacteriales bacterium]